MVVYHGSLRVGFLYLRAFIIVVKPKGTEALTHE